MNGIAYARRQKNLMQKEVARLAGVEVATVGRLESPEAWRVSYLNALKVTNALGISMNEIFKEYLDVPFSSSVVRGDHEMISPGNVIDWYRSKAGLSFRDMQGILHMTGQGAWNACHREVAYPKHIAALAEYLKISVGELIKKFEEDDAI